MSGGGIVFSCGFGFILACLVLIDIRHYSLPDILTLPLVPLGLLAAFLGQPAALPDHIAGALAGFFFFYAVMRLYRWLKGCDGLGLGDAKLLAGIGAFVSWTGLPLVVAIASTGALIFVVCRTLVHRQSVAMNDKVAFGPFLALGGWIVWIYGPLMGRIVT